MHGSFPRLCALLQKISCRSFRCSFHVSGRVSSSPAFGFAAALHLRLDHHLLNRPQRLAGLENEYIGVETLMGDDEKIEFDDFLGGTL